MRKRLAYGEIRQLVAEQSQEIAEKADAVALASKADAAALAGKADAAAVTQALASKADATAVNQALSGKASAAAVALKADISAVPVIATDTPLPEKTGGAAGVEAMKVPGAGHQHPSISSRTRGTLGATGLSGNMMFTRTFTAEPSMTLTPLRPGGNQPVSLQVDSWILSKAGVNTTYGAGANMPVDADGKTTDGSVFAGCIVKGYRGQVAATVQPLNVLAILGAVITGVNTLIAAISGFNPNGGSVDGVKFSCVALQRSDIV